MPSLILYCSYKDTYFLSIKSLVVDLSDNSYNSLQKKDANEKYKLRAFQKLRNDFKGRGSTIFLHIFTSILRGRGYFLEL